MLSLALCAMCTVEIAVNCRVVWLSAKVKQHNIETKQDEKKKNYTRTQRARETEYMKQFLFYKWSLSLFASNSRSLICMCARWK